MSKYPSWAPRLLVSLYEHALSQVDQPPVGKQVAIPGLFLSRERRVSLLKALISDDRMAYVWRTLPNWTEEFKSRLPAPKEHGEIVEALFDLPQGEAFKLSLRMNQIINRSQCGSLFNACTAAICRFERHPKWTGEEAEDHFEQMATTADKLASLLFDIQRKVDGLDDITDYFDSSHFEGLAHAFDMAGDPDLAELGGAGSYVKFWVSDALPSLPFLLMDLAKRARALQKEPPALSQPNSPRAEMRFFQEYLSNYFKRAYGQPLHKQVADITSAAFGCDVTEENVRKLLSYRQSKASNPE